jgi:hypothetical protein
MSHPLAVVVPMKPDEVLARLAARQDGLFTRQQVRSEGLTDRMLDTRIVRGSIVRIEPGVFRIAGAPVTWRQRVRAATWTEDGLASHRTAAALWELEGCRPGVVEVVTERWRRRPNASVRVHETSMLPESDRSTIDGIAVTAPPRTLVDLAAAVPAERVDAAMADACNRGLTTPGEIWECTERLLSPGRPWVSAVRRMLGPRLELGDVQPNTFELLLFRALQAAGAPRPVAQVEIRRPDGTSVGRVDWLIGARVIVECDSKRWHGSWRRREADLRRDRELVALGYIVLRFTWDDVANHPDLVARDVLAALYALSA